MANHETVRRIINYMHRSVDNAMDELDVGNDDEKLAVASALLAYTVALHRNVLGAEKTATMVYRVADELAVDVSVPKKIKIPRKRSIIRKKRK